MGHQQHDSRFRLSVGHVLSRHGVSQRPPLELLGVPPVGPLPCPDCPEVTGPRKGAGASAGWASGPPFPQPITPRIGWLRNGRGLWGPDGALLEGAMTGQRIVTAVV